MPMLGMENVGVREGSRGRPVRTGNYLHLKSWAPGVGDESTRWTVDASDGSIN